MIKEHAADETTVVATYLNRHDADVAKSFLEDRGIKSFVIADDVHVPLQLTDGVRLTVMGSDAMRAHEALEDADMLPDTTESAADATPGLATRTTTWFYVGLVGAVVLVILIGLAL